MAAYRNCIICGTRYKACVDCAASWKAVCDTPDHYQIYSVIQMSRMDTPKETLKEMLAAIPESSFENLLPEVQEYINTNILDSETTEDTTSKKKTTRSAKAKTAKVTEDTDEANS